MEKAYRKFVVWKKAHALAVEIYEVTKKFPDDERFGLTSQMRRSAFSIPANFVEGYARGTSSQLLHFVSIARASLAELEYALEFANDVKILAQQDYDRLENLRGEVGYLFHRFVQSIKTKENT